MRINTGEKSYPCNQGKISFSQDGDLKKSLKSQDDQDNEDFRI